MKRALIPVLVVLGMGCAAAVAQTAKQPIGLDDMLAWKSIRGTALSPNGQWFAYLEGGAVGDGSAVFRQTHGSTVYRFNLGEPPLPPARGLPPRGRVWWRDGYPVFERRAVWRVSGVSNARATGGPAQAA